MTALRTLWAWLQGLPAPAPTPTTLGPTLAPPAGEAREPVSDQDGVRMRAVVAHQRELMDLLCMHANAHVYRDYGTGGYVVEYDAPQTLDPAAAQRAAEGLGIATYEGTAPETLDDRR